jgi:hypothetical protein
MLSKHSHHLELLMKEVSFNASLSFREQCYSACRILRTDNDPPVPFALIGKIFEIDQVTTRNHANKYAADLNRIGSPGRQLALLQDKIDHIIAGVLRFFEERKPLTLPKSAPSSQKRSSEQP